MQAVSTCVGSVIRVTAFLLGTLIATNRNAQAIAGAPDLTFGGTGLATYASPPDAFGQVQDRGNDLVVEPDGKVVAAGFTNGNNGGAHIIVVRWNADGTLDPTFGTSGVVHTNITNSDGAFAIVRQPSDGKYVIAGSNDVDFLLIRYNTDGTLDTSFDTDGIVTTEFSGYDRAYDLILQPDEKLIAAGYSQGSGYGMAVARYNTNGSLDTSFDTDGKYVNSSMEQISALALQSDGKILVAGTRDNGCAPCGDFAILRLTSTGAVDSSFGTSGMAVASFSPSTSRIHEIAVLSSGEILAVGGVGFGWEQAGLHGIAKFLSTGALDSSFGTAGKASFNVAASFDESHAFVVEPSGNLIVTGLSTPGGGGLLYRVTTSGALDTSFGTAGIVNFDGAGEGIVRMADGRLVTVGLAPINNTDLAVRRFYNNTCGDGSTEPSEECDDGDAEDGDGCDSNCTTTACGNGIVTAGEECDDGNAIEDDACLSTCQLVPTPTPTPTITPTSTPTFTPTSTPTITPTSTPTPGCGDGILHGGEQCDDGNLIDGDCCSASCQLVHHPDCLEPFLCYAAKVTSKTAAYEPDLGVGLEDRFRTSTADLTKPERFCAPASVDGENPTAPASPDHLFGTKAKHLTKFAGALNQTVVDRFGTQQINIKSPINVLHPAAKSLVSPPAPPSTLLDSFQCYKIKSVEKFVPSNPYVGIEDPFGTRTYQVKKPSRLCAPVDVDGTSPGSATHPNHLMCYSIKQVSAPPFTAVTPIYINGTFGALTVDATKPKEICVPAFFNPECGNGVIESGEQCEASDCCTANCQIAADGTPCTSDGNSCTADVCHDNGQCGFDTCLHTFSGVATNLDQSTLTGTGWTECYSSAYYETGDSIGGILGTCNQANLLLGCRAVGSSTLIAAAHAPRADVTFNTGPGDTVHNANGVGWYYNYVINDYGSWGFAAEGDAVVRNQCDIAASSLVSGVNPEQRVCWHTYNAALSGGWRCGASTFLNSDGSTERVIFQAP